MLFAITCTDKPESLPIRLATRDAHIAYLRGHAASLVQAGPLLDPQGRPCGSLLLVDVADAAAAEALTAGDPYGRAGLFESVVVRPFRSVFRDGALVG